VVPLLGAGLFAQNRVPNPLLTLDASGVLGTYSASGRIDVNNAFFQNLGDERTDLQLLPCIESSLVGNTSWHQGAFRHDARDGSYFPSR